MIVRLRNGLAALAMLLMASLFSTPVAAQDNTSAGELVVATREAPPFAMRSPDGEWRGLAIELWDRVADDKGYAYRLEEASLADMIDGVEDGRFDASVGALTITSQREERVDFTHPFTTTGFGIAVHRSPSSWVALLGNFFTWQFFEAIALLCAMLLIVGFLFWLAERKANSDEFPTDARKGVGSGFWFSAVTMTTVGYGDKAPRTVAGKIVALVWMFTAILIISTFTGMIASSLTADRLSGSVTGPGDLPGVSVGSIEGSASDEWLRSEGAAFRAFEDISSGLTALRDGKIEAFVYDAPLLRYRVHRSFRSDLRVLPAAYGRQDYGFALPQGSPLREDIDVTLLRVIDSDQWIERVNSTLGAHD